MRALLDTNAYVALRRGDPGVASLVRDSEKIIFSAVVAGELLHGFHRGTRTTENIRSLEQFLDQPFVLFLPVTWTTADRFGRIASGLRKKGRPIPTNDIWIAAQALESGADLISLDQHFEHVDGLAWVKPSKS